MRLKKRAFLFFLFLAFIVIAVPLSIYVYFFLPKNLSSAETAERLASIYSRTNGILSLMRNDVEYLTNGTISVTEFTNRMQTKRNDMTMLRAELSKLREVAHSSYELSISFLDIAMQAYINALGAAYDLNFSLTTQYLQQGTTYVELSKNALPKT